MDRWTMKELADTDDITFAICILDERGRGLTPYSPLKMKLQEAAGTLQRIKDETEKYRAAINEACKGTLSEENADVYADDDGEETDLSDCDEETKAEILANAALLDARQCDPCQPTQPECGECEFAGGAEDEIA